MGILLILQSVGIEKDFYVLLQNGNHDNIMQSLHYGKITFCFTSFASDYNYKRAIFLDGPKKDFGKYSESVVPASALLHRSCVTSLACGYKKNFMNSLFYG